MTSTRSLQEVVLAIHFGGPLPFSVLEAADLVREFGGPETGIQALPKLPTSTIPAPSGALSGFQFIEEDGSLPRIRFRGSNPSTLYVFQADRLGVGWQRVSEIGDEDDYPGYDVLKTAWCADIARFAQWVKARLGISLAARLVELSYNNAYPLVVDGRQRKLGEIFKLISADYRPVNALQVNWGEYVGSATEGLVTAQAGLGNAPPGQRVLAVNYFGLGAVGTPEPGVGLAEVVMQVSDKLHARILDIHAAAIMSGA